MNFVLIFILVFFTFATPVFAQITGYGNATALPIDIPNLQDGSIISSTRTGYILSTESYDPTMVGVVSFNPAVLVNNPSDPELRPVISTGVAYVRVSSRNGVIHQGDDLTTSSIPGVAEKATEPGYVLGESKQDYTDPNPKHIGRIVVSVYPHLSQVSDNIASNLANGWRLAVSSLFNSPVGSLRYFVAGFVILLSFILGFSFFGRTSSRGIEALGRNPLAGRNIMLGILLNVFLTITIMALGVAVGYTILVL